MRPDIFKHFLFYIKLYEQFFIFGLVCDKLSYNFEKKTSYLSKQHQNYLGIYELYPDLQIHYCPQLKGFGNLVVIEVHIQSSRSPYLMEVRENKLYQGSKLTGARGHWPPDFFQMAPRFLRSGAQIYWPKYMGPLYFRNSNM